MGRGRDTLPLHPIPKTKPGRLHKNLDTPSELVFSIHGENRGGYELFYDDFKKHAKFEFTYH